MSFTTTLKLSVRLDWTKQVYYYRSGTPTSQICTRVGRTEHLVILLVILEQTEHGVHMHASMSKPQGRQGVLA